MKVYFCVALLMVGGLLAAQDNDVLTDERLARVISFKTEAPAGLPLEIPTPSTSPMTEKAWELGQMLFSDPELSSDRTVSCASCHVPNLAFSSRDPFPAGVVGKRALREHPWLRDHKEEARIVTRSHVIRPRPHDHAALDPCRDLLHGVPRHGVEDGL